MELNLGEFVGGASSLSLGQGSLKLSFPGDRAMMFGFLHPAVVWEETVRQTSQRKGPWN